MHRWTYAFAGVALDFLKSGLPILGAVAWHERKPARSSACWLVFAVLTTLSLWCAYGTTATQHAEKFANQAVAQTTEERRQATLDRLRKQRDTLSFTETSEETVRTAETTVAKGGFPDMQGTWVHPYVAIHLAQWLSPRFAVRVSQWVHEWMTQGPRGKAALPFHLRRYLANYTNVPVGHFSVLTEMTLTLIAPLELMGYTLPESMWPDISEGRMFAGWLRRRGIEPNELPTYRHVFEDGRRAVSARAYPESLLADFRRHVRDFWMPIRAMEYFKDRDPNALRYLPQLLPAPTDVAQKKAG